MSIWADQQVKVLMAKVAELEARVSAVEGFHVKHQIDYIPLDSKNTVKIDKRTREWKNANSHQ